LVGRHSVSTNAISVSFRDDLPPRLSINVPPGMVDPRMHRSRHCAALPTIYLLILANARACL
jgi:hypothetical protein